VDTIAMFRVVKTLKAALITSFPAVLPLDRPSTRQDITGSTLLLWNPYRLLAPRARALSIFDWTSRDGGYPN